MEIFETKWTITLCNLNRLQNPGLTSINQKCLSYISPHRNCLSNNCLHQMYGKMLIIQFSYNFLKNFQVKLKLPQNFFRFFFNVKSNFVHKQTFSEKKICMQILIFFLHNVVHDAQKFKLFPFLWITFLKLLYIFVWHVNICLDQCLIT